MYLVAIAWIYVALMMAVAEATHAQGSVLGGLMTFLLYGVGPLALVLYLLGTPQRRAARRAAEAAEASSGPGSKTDDPAAAATKPPPPSAP
ncbi:hypothetical protein [Aquariibacter albus]|uniref:Uncharacterized protein n=1 Tax=Aquariibacter albus TaxID=2759899 RepID=A0A839HT49_9BURK|nr:hypothetical protein [Aquariibacter albus]MBB1161064.1 hypothetical protein [Aquariibacter albus]